MSDDIVQRLRCWPCMGLSDPTDCTLCDAADEIERLRALITAWADADQAVADYDAIMQERLSVDLTLGDL